MATTNNFIIKTRYQYRAASGEIEWTNWYILMPNPMSKSDADEYINNIKKLYNDIDKKTKLNHEYLIVSTEDYEQELHELNAKIASDKARDDAYFASDKWKELKHKKYVSRKERKQKQAEYLEMQKQLEHK